MTKKDYVLIANAINKESERSLGDNISRTTYCAIVDNLVYVFSLDNPRFNAKKFYDACGLRDK